MYRGKQISAGRPTALCEFMQSARLGVGGCVAVVFVSSWAASKFVALVKTLE